MSDSAGLGLAVGNRLKKAAGFHTEEADGAFVLGITGGTGAGKTTLLHALERRGALVLDCDAVYHEMLRTDAPLRADLTRRVRRCLRPRRRIGPAKAGQYSIRRRRRAWRSSTPSSFRHLPRALARRMEESGARLIALDAIKLVESGLGALCDVTVAVTAPEEVRVRRLMTRDGISEDYARARVRAQRSERRSARTATRSLKITTRLPRRLRLPRRSFWIPLLKNPRRNEPWQRRKRTSGRRSSLMHPERL